MTLTPMLRIGTIRADQESDIGMPSIPVCTHDSLGCKMLAFVSPSQAIDMINILAK